MSEMDPKPENNKYIQNGPPEIPEEFWGTVSYYLQRLRVKVKFYLRKVVPAVSREERSKVQVDLREESKPDFDYSVLVFLSCTIATLGLLIDSPATIIGAMLVAPLMSPILGIGLASIRGDTTLLTDAVKALLQGALLAIVLSTIITWVNTLLPFVSLQDIPQEVLVRTQPSPIDLGVALAGGLAATFALAQPQLSAALPGVAIATALMPPLCAVGVGIALGDWSVAAGAFLLFVTNAVTIAASSIFLFFILGFSPTRREGSGLIPGSLWISIGLTMVLLIPLAITSYNFVVDATFTYQINEVVKEEVESIGAELIDMSWGENQIDGESILVIDVDVQVTSALSHPNSVELQNELATRLDRIVQLKVNQVIAAQLNPLNPPTHTPTATLGPSPIPSNTPMPITPTGTAIATFTPIATATFTATATLTPTPAQAILAKTYGDGTYLRAFPDGPSLIYMPEGTELTVLYGYEILDGWVWVEVVEPFGRTGWVQLFFLSTPTPTSTPFGQVAEPATSTVIP